jgi:hypothetical protein
MEPLFSAVICGCNAGLFREALVGQWRYSLFTDKLSATMPIAKRVYSLAQTQK